MDRVGILNENSRHSGSCFELLCSEASTWEPAVWAVLPKAQPGSGQIWAGGV